MPPNKIYVQGGTTGNGPSKLRSLMLCPREYAFSRNVWTGSNATSRGSLVHAGLSQLHAIQGAKAGGCWVGSPGENRWVSQEEADQLATPEEGILAEAQALGVPPNGELVNIARSAVAAYEAQNLHNRARVIAVETVVRLETAHGTVTPRVDLINQDTAGRFFIVDTKTTAKADRRTATAYSNDIQMLALTWYGRQAWGPQFGGVLLTLINVSTSPPSSYTTPTTCGSALVAEVPRVIQRTAAIEQQYRGRPPEEWPANPTEHTCVNRYRVCPFLSVCKG